MWMVMIMIMIWWLFYDDLMSLSVAIIISFACRGQNIFQDIAYSMAWIDERYWCDWCAFSHLFLLAFHVSWIASFRLGLKLDYHDTSVGAVCLDMSCWIWEQLQRVPAGTPAIHSPGVSKTQGFPNWWSQDPVDDVDVCWPEAPESLSRPRIDIQRDRSISFNIHVCHCWSVLWFEINMYWIDQCTDVLRNM